MKKLLSILIIASVAIMAVSCKNANKEAETQEEACEEASTLNDSIDQAGEAIGDAVNDALNKLGGIASGAVSNLSEELKAKGIFSEGMVDEKPTFKGGDAESFQKWVQDHAKYPEEAKENNEAGKVLVNFNVNKKGKIEDVRVLLGVSRLLDEEAVRVVSSAPNWKPATINGTPVTVNYTMPVVFKLVK